MRRQTRPVPSTAICPAIAARRTAQRPLLTEPSGPRCTPGLVVRAARPPRRYVPAAPSGGTTAPRRRCGAPPSGPLGAASARRRRRGGAGSRGGRGGGGSPLAATFDLQHQCSGEVPKCLIFLLHLSHDIPGPAHGYSCTYRKMPGFSCICKIGRNSPTGLVFVFWGVTRVSSGSSSQY